MLQEAHHADVEVACVVTDVDEAAYKGKTPVLVEILVDKAGPTGLFALGDLGVTVAGEVDEVDHAGDEEVYGRRLAGGRGDHGELLAPEKLVDERGLAYVGASGERNFGQGALGQLGGGAKRLVKTNVAVIDLHVPSLGRGRAAGPFGCL